ncbi:secreted protein [Cadophora sp. MPI-SDFR-AT-0126]|nr:secreted protein [Leotiomycetes sp. MPI-SDFR-AT-0126]
MSSILFVSGIFASVAHAYTQVNVASPFMTKNIDPIVFPGQYDKSHLHSFFGSDAVTINTNTSAELQAGCTNAENPNDLSVYWVPTPLYTTDGGKTYSPMPISRFSAYYNLGETEAKVAIPQNLQMVAGIATATTEAGMDHNAQSSWSCESESVALDANGFPSSTCSTHIQQLLYFPQCVNPSTLETAYKNKRGGTCPTGMKSMPQLRFSIRWDVRKVLPDGWSGTAPFKLASGPAWSSHGDFINGWTEEAASNMLATTKEKQKFSGVDGALGTYNSGPTCRATDADPGNGTGDYAESVAAMSKRDMESWGWSSKSRFIRD